MEFSMSSVWWLLAGVAVVAELTTGTFYLLMVALGLVAGAIAAHLGVSTALQITTAALAGAAATASWHWRRMRHPRSAPAAENRDVNLDIGERINVTAWQPDRTSRVPYRGSLWTARLQAGAPVVGGEHVVKAVEGNWLVLAPVTPH